MKKHLFSCTPERDHKGRAIIRINVINDDGFLSPFSKGSTPVISSDVSEFLERQTEALPPKTPLTLRVRGECIDENEKKAYAEAVTGYYAERFKAVNHAFRRNLLLSLVLAVLGIAALALALFTEAQTGSPIWTEAVDIVAWVLLWEAADVSLFRNYELRVSRRRYRAFTEMPVTFE